MSTKLVGMIDPYQNVQEFTLENKLQVILVSIPGVPWIYTDFLIHVGSSNDPKQKRGMAHLIEHLTSENVPGFADSEDLSDFFESMGGSVNLGGTGDMHTQYGFFVPVQNFAEAMRLMSTLLLDLKITAYIDREKEIIQQEYHQEYSFTKYREWYLMMQKAIFSGHPYLADYDSALGLPEEFMTITTEEIQQFYDGQYNPANTTIIVVGNIKREELLTILYRNSLGTRPAGSMKNTFPKPFTPKKPNPNELIVRLSDYGQLTSDHATCLFRWAVPTTFSLTQMNVFTHVVQKYLYRELRSKRGLIYDVNVSTICYWDVWRFSITVDIDEENIPLLKSFIDSWEGVTPERFIQSQQVLINFWLLTEISSGNFTEMLSNDIILKGKLTSLSQKVADLQSVTFADLQAIANYLKRERQFFRAYLP